MIKQLATLAVLQLGLVAPAFATPMHHPVATLQGADIATTGSLPTDRAPQAGRSLDSSAKGGNADETNHAVPNFGTTSGGPAF